ncbi:DUF3800 domain-containing protein [Niallia circulans]|uniref:DUF3800 domain-containing protein n=1 Tax=Niallia circulans TaxID=1397 RepID=UPI001561AA8A|nr:DUF3800 domain-containing protein [Niallia circulans]NRG34423.1 DUF3800 domain-containing protein [Niallia circulans]
MSFLQGISLLRDRSIKMNGLQNVDIKYTFFYDETNNPKKFRITTEGFNVSEDDFFILGGIVYRSDNYISDEKVNELFSELITQKNMKEIKFKQASNSAKDFYSTMKAKKIALVLKWLEENKIWIHYSYRDNFYYGIVDLVDSLGDIYYLPIEIVTQLKTVLYKYIKLDQENFVGILRHYNYPNISDVNRFIWSVLDWLFDKEFHDWQEDFLIEYLRQSLKTSRKDGLQLLENNTDFEMISSFEDIYLNRIIIFSNSFHYFDEEATIEEKLSGLQMTINGSLLNNYEFINSRGNKFTQVSDIVVGIIRTWLSYINKSSIERIEEDFSNCSEKELDSVVRFVDIVKNSQQENKAFEHWSIDFHTAKKISYFLDLVSLKGKRA